MKLLAYSSNIETPIDYQNTFNLALYHLAAAHPEESDQRYTSNLTARSNGDQWRSPLPPDR
jgi:hypothetical protein